MNTVKEVQSLLSDGFKICTDSREVNNSSIFVALKGENFDGNRFVHSALEKGAKLCIVDSKDIEPHNQIRQVSNSLAFLQDIASFHRNSFNIPIIGLTGSNGKTTTKELIACILRKRFKTFATQGNLNNHIGVPISVLSIDKSHEIGIIEMGANHVGEIANLCSIAKPTHGLITNIGKAHLEGFGSFEGVIKAKTELYRFMEETKGSVFVNSNNNLLNRLISEYSFSNLIRYQGNDVEIYSAEKGKSYLEFDISIDNSLYRIESQLVGDYNIENIVAAICIGIHFGIEINDCIDAIKEYAPTNSRSQIVHTKSNTIVLDAYNANPTSLEHALRNFATLSNENPKMVILGEMLELGDYAHEEHTLIADLAKGLFKEIILIGENFRHIQGHVKWFATSADCSKHISTNSIQNHTILLKGSRGVRLEMLLDYL